MVALHRYRLLGAVIAWLCFVGAATADDHALYLGVAGGMNVPTTNAEARRDTEQTPEEIYEIFDYNLDHGYSLSGSIGAYIKDFRIEFQCAGQSNDIESVESLGMKTDIGGELDAMQFMGNVLYDIPLTKQVTAFLGMGVGVAQVWLRPDEHLGQLRNQDGLGLAYQGIAGLAWEIGPGVCITADYRVWSAADIDMQDVDLEMPLFHMVELGVRFSF